MPSCRTLGANEEVSFQEMTNPSDEAQLKGGYKKIVGACAQAYDDEHEWIWIEPAALIKVVVLIYLKPSTQCTDIMRGPPSAMRIGVM
jgi:hypothetical protein